MRLFRGEGQYGAALGRDWTEVSVNLAWDPTPHRGRQFASEEVAKEFAHRPCHNHNFRCKRPLMATLRERAKGRIVRAISSVRKSTLKPVVANNEKFRGYLSANRYTLTLGAGISRGIAPDWQDLTQELMSLAFSQSIPKETFDDLLKLGWSLDGLIQNAANEFKRKGKTNTEVTEAIEQCLYANIRNKARGLGLEKYLTAVLNRPKTIEKNKVIEVCEFLENSFPDSSLFPICRYLVDSAKLGHAPLAVISFNADTFLETYIDLHLRRNHYLGPPPHGHPPYYYSAVNGSGAGRGSKIPIYHCHGSIAPLERAGGHPKDRRDRLVFLEEEYLALSSGRSAWAQSVFLFHAQSTRMAFCGLSMSDANIRRWMSAIEADVKDYHYVHGNSARSNPEHIWIRPKPLDELSEEILLSSLTHLGVTRVDRGMGATI